MGVSKNTLGKIAPGYKNIGSAGAGLLGGFSGSRSGILGNISQVLFGKDLNVPLERNTLLDYGTNLLNDVSPLRGELLGRYTNFLKGNLDLSQSPQFQAAKAINEAQLQKAKQNITETGVAGGGLAQALSNAEIQNALGLTQAGGDIANQELDRAMQLYGGTQATGAQMLQTSGELANQIANMNNQRELNREGNWLKMWGNIGSFWGTTGMSGGMGG